MRGRLRSRSSATAAAADAAAADTDAVAEKRGPSTDTVTPTDTENYKFLEYTPWRRHLRFQHKTTGIKIQVKRDAKGKSKSDILCKAHVQAKKIATLRDQKAQVSRYDDARSHYEPRAAHFRGLIPSAAALYPR